MLAGARVLSQVVLMKLLTFKRLGAIIVPLISVVSLPASAAATSFPAYVFETPPLSPSSATASSQLGREIIGGFEVANIDRGYVFPVGYLGAVLDFFSPVPPDAPYGARGGYHSGINLAASLLDPVGAPGPGVVTFVGSVFGNPTVSVLHPDGLTSSLQPVSASVLVGDAVAAGSTIGLLENWRAYENRDSSHCPGSFCLYWGVRRSEHNYVDPLWLLGLAAPIVLLPN